MGTNKEEFIRSFKERVVNGVYYNMPKDYRKSDEYGSLDLDQRFEQALEHSSIVSVMEAVVGDLYDEYVDDIY